MLRVVHLEYGWIRDWTGGRIGDMEVKLVCKLLPRSGNNSTRLMETNYILSGFLEIRFL